ncbi:hypothetical protein CcaverHIS002_0404630 [Cutaneotrichosporon cavernicola]|uniref:BTB domain-containing protein n=1 Tax=Cutaneotrichosporon cavernicola TaxID=279322 RepID=A0AA48L462_9TREE|nr:uncharacterized protein CcaverHIS019_0404590 [Cutaneotrichosporon cavernicola]BEI83859.1 hypothetical protein CcaverHIS002_0404630 [Cutaneotrichosporon cavernicola]BEI91639.1 hypothetical protein CcaverHIS019_0404590 [Cutaneotrichosporon cavernicola]BEI99415.1 hypothetical protein CcaverHIS631_0404580 [Cutaneotrichosporon cavernicola]BEJ07193.1 hypothetical protein CcaverHIS641_0404620 [Cutaneotrichosporon cavernicola]
MTISGPCTLQTTSDPDWTTGNFTVVTSDNVSFKIHDYQLFATSAQFATAKSMAEAGASVHDNIIHFDDTILETAEVFRIFLKFATTLLPPMDLPVPSLGSLLLFLRKWDCDALEALMVRTFHHGLLFGDLRPFHVFRVGVRVDDIKICKLALTEKMRARIQHKDRIEDNLVPKDWPPSLWKLFDSAYIYALTKSAYASSRPEEFEGYYLDYMKCEE